MSQPRTSCRVAVIHPRIQGYGGAERYSVEIARVLKHGMAVDVISEHAVDPRAIETAFGVRLDGVRFVCDPRCSPVAGAKGAVVQAVERRQAARAFRRMTREYDLVFAQTTGLPKESGAPNSVAVCHFPCVHDERLPDDAHLAPWWRTTGRRQREVRRRLNAWRHVVTSSEYAAQYLRRYWGLPTTVVYPAVQIPSDPPTLDKKPWIIGVGAFARHAHMAHEPWSFKRQELLVDVFKGLCDSGLAGWELHLAGHALLIPEVDALLARLRAQAAGYPVFLHPNCPHHELTSLYRQGSLFWHAVGYGVDVHRQPEQVEHFGIVTVEAMSWGCIPVVVDLGGQPEIVRHQENGLLWSTLEDLVGHTQRLVADEGMRYRYTLGAMRRARDFGPERFRSDLMELIDGELRLAVE